MSSSRPSKTFDRSTVGLRDALFSEMEDLREGIAAPHEAVAFSNLASRIIESVQLDLRHEEMELRQRAAGIRERELALHETGILKLAPPVLEVSVDETCDGIGEEDFG